jgi:hypothetical protein
MSPGAPRHPPADQARWTTPATSSAGSPTSSRAAARRVGETAAASDWLALADPTETAVVVVARAFGAEQDVGTQVAQTDLAQSALA